MNDKNHIFLSLDVTIPIDKSKTLSSITQEQIKKSYMESVNKKNVLLTDVDRDVLKKPRQSISDLEPIIRGYLIEIFQQHRVEKNASVEEEAQWQVELKNKIDAIIYGADDDDKSTVRKRDRIRFFAKAISSNRILSIEDCDYISSVASELTFLNQTRGFIGFILDDLAIFHMTLIYFSNMLELYQSSFSALLLNYFANSLIICAGTLQVLSILKENKPLKLKHYAHIGFILTTTSLGLIGYCTGAAYLSVIASSLSMLRNLLIFTNELVLYQSSKPGSDQQKAHAQACISALNDIILSTLAISVILAVSLVPISTLMLTAFILMLTVLKVTWNLSSLEQKIFFKQMFALDKQDYQEVLAMPVNGCDNMNEPILNSQEVVLLAEQVGASDTVSAELIENLNNQKDSRKRKRDDVLESESKELFPKENKKFRLKSKNDVGENFTEIKLKKD